MVFLFVLWTAAIGFRLVQLQVIQHSELKNQVERQNQNQDDIIPQRGTIFDRNGNKLACSVPRAFVFYSKSKTSH